MSPSRRLFARLFINRVARSPSENDVLAVLMYVSEITGALRRVTWTSLTDSAGVDYAPVLGVAQACAPSPARGNPWRRRFSLRRELCRLTMGLSASRRVCRFVPSCHVSLTTAHLRVGETLRWAVPGAPCSAAILVGKAMRRPPWRRPEQPHQGFPVRARTLRSCESRPAWPVP